MNIISGQFDPHIHNIDLQRWYRCHIVTSGMGSILASTQSKNSHVRANKALFTSCIPHVAPPTLESSLKLVIIFVLQKTFIDWKRICIDITDGGSVVSWYPMAENIYDSTITDRRELQNLVTEKKSTVVVAAAVNSCEAARGGNCFPTALCSPIISSGVESFYLFILLFSREIRTHLKRCRRYKFSHANAYFFSCRWYE